MMGRSRHATDILFTLALFCVFAVCALMVVMLGADVYRKGTREMEQNFDARTSLSYLATKLRQGDRRDGVTLGELGGVPALVLSDELEGAAYNTWIYCQDGALREVLMARELSPTPDMGQPIMALESLEAEFLDSGILRVTVTEPDGRVGTLLYTPRCG